MGEGKDIDLGGQVIGESTKITLSVKTALWIIGGVIALFSTIFTYAYFDVKAEVANYKSKLEQSNQALVKQIDENITLKLDKQRDRDDKFIEDIAKIRGDVQLILDRTQRLGGNNAIDGAPTINNNGPNNEIPVRTH
jgi:hypothetical protein